MKLIEVLVNNRVKDPRKSEQTVLLKGADLDMELMANGYVSVIATRTGAQIVIGPGNVKHAEVMPAPKAAPAASK